MQVGDLLVKLGADFTQYNKDLAKAEGMAKKSGSTIGDIFKNAFSVTLGMGVFDAAKKGFNAITNAGIGFNAMMQTANIGFATMLGSAQKADRFLSDLATFAKATPFEFPELVDAAKRMLAYGFAAEEVIPILTAVGDAAAGLGAGKEGIDRITLALGQIRAKGKLSAEEMRQLTEAGVPAWDMLADAMGKTTAEIMDMQQKGLIPAEEAVAMITEGMTKRFGGMMKEMENTWEGVTSTIKDIWNMTIGMLTENIFKGINQWLIGVRDFAQKFYDALKAGGIEYALQETLGRGAANAFAILNTVITGAWNIISGFFNFIRSNWNIFGPLIKGALLLYTSFKFVTLVTMAAELATKSLTTAQLILAGQSTATSGILGFLNTVMIYYKVQMLSATGATGIFTGALYSLRAALIAVWTALGPIGWAVLAIAGVLGVGIGLWNKYNASLQRTSQTASQADLAKGFRDVEKSSQAAADGIGEQTDAMKESKKAASDNIQSFDEVHQLQKDIGDAAGDMTLDTPALDEMIMPEMPDMGGIGGMLDDIEAELPPFGERVKGFFGWLWDGIKTGAVTAWNAIGGILESSWNWIYGLSSGIFTPMATFIADTWRNLATLAGTIWGIIWQTISAIWNDYLTMSKTIFGAVFDFISSTWEGLKTTAFTIWDAIKTFFTSIWENIKTTASTIWQAIADLITGKIDLRTAISIIWTAIKDFLTNTWNSISVLASTIWTAIAGFITGTWENLKITAEIIWTAIATFLANTWNNIQTAVMEIWEAIKVFLIATWEGLKAMALAIWDTIKQYIINPMIAVWGKIQEIWNNIKFFILRKWDEIRQGISNMAQPLINAIKSPFIIAKDWIADIIDDAYNWGKNLIENITKGIKATVGKVKDAVVGVVDTVKGYIGFSSPTKEGPGRYADQWAPNLIRMYAEGIIRNTGLVESAASGVAGSLSGMSRVSSTPQFAGATAGAAPEIHLHVGALIADDYGLKKLEQRLRNIRIYEDQRVGDTR